VALGSLAGQTGQNNLAVAVGYAAGQTGQGTGSVAVGAYAGQTGQAAYSAAIGFSAGQLQQGAYALALGYQAGNSQQGTGSVAIGYQAGFTGQKPYSVAIGYQAGFTGHGTGSIAIGYQAGYADATGPNSIAIGTQAGLYGLGANSIAIGNLAGPTGAAYNNNIILNAAGTSLSPNTGSAFYVAPIRNLALGGTGIAAADISNTLFYNPTTSEITYGPTKPSVVTYYAGSIQTTTSNPGTPVLLKFDTIDSNNSTGITGLTTNASPYTIFTNSTTRTMYLNVEYYIYFLYSSDNLATWILNNSTSRTYGGHSFQYSNSTINTMRASATLVLLPSQSFSIYVDSANNVLDTDTSINNSPQVIITSL
jgi:hypothetical protein